MLARQSRPSLWMPWASIHARVHRHVVELARRSAASPGSRPRGPSSSTRMMPSDAGLGAIDRLGGDRDVGLGALVRGEHLAEVHAVELVAGEDQHVLDAGLSRWRRFLRTASAVP